MLDSYKYKNLNIETIVVKKYPNRRLYNTKTSAYITLEDLASLIKNDYNVLVVDSQTEENLTKLTLTQVVLDQQVKGCDILPLEFLKQLIKLHDHSLSAIFTEYLKLSAEYFQKNHSYMNEMIGMISNSFAPITFWNQSLNQQNIEFFKLMFSSMSVLNILNNKPDPNNNDI